MISRVDERTRWSSDPAAIELCESEAEERSRPDDSGDAYGWAADEAADRESRWAS